MAVLTGKAQTFPFRERMILLAVQTKARTGMNVSRNMPTLKQLREAYGITARTWQQAADQLPAAIEKRIEELEMALNA